LREGCRTLRRCRLGPHLRDETVDRTGLVVNQHDLCCAVRKDLESNPITHSRAHSNRCIEANYDATVSEGRESAPLISLVVVKKQTGRTSNTLHVRSVLADHRSCAPRIIEHNEAARAHLICHLKSAIGKSCGEAD